MTDLSKEEKKVKKNKFEKMVKNILIIFSFLFLTSYLSADTYEKETIKTQQKEFNSEVSVADTLDLNTAIKIAMVKNPDILASYYDIETAKARYESAVSSSLPNLRFSTSYNYYSDAQRLFPARKNGEPGVFTSNILSSDIVLSFPLFTGGQLINAIKSAELLEKSAEKRMFRTKEELIFNISMVFFNILAQEKVIESVEFSYKTMQEHLERTEELIKLQKAAPVDRLWLEVRLAELKQKIVQEKNLLSILKRTFINLLGIEKDPENLQLIGTLEIPKDNEIYDENYLFTSALQKRPDYIATKLNLEAQAKNLNAVRAMRFPVISLFGSYGLKYAINPIEKPPGTENTEYEGRIGIFLEFPVFDSGRISSKIKEEKSKLASLQEHLRKIELQIKLEVENAILNINSAKERISVAEKAIEQAKETLRIEQLKYELGKGTIVDVLDAQTSLLEAQTSYYRALSSYYISIYQLKLATGELL